MSSGKANLYSFESSQKLLTNITGLGPRLVTMVKADTSLVALETDVVERRFSVFASKTQML